MSQTGDVNSLDLLRAIKDFYSCYQFYAKILKGNNATTISFEMPVKIIHRPEIDTGIIQYCSLSIFKTYA